MITSDRMAAVDRNAAALGVPQRVLMESSGNAIARAVRDLVDPGSSVAIICGRGNNGGDGFVAARFLTDYDVSVTLIGRSETISTQIARANWEALVSAAFEPTAVTDSADFDPEAPDLIVDALVGTGITGDLREPLATVVERLNDLDAPVLAVDVPSGVNADTGEATGAAIAADRVVTFHDRKPGLADLEATVTVADIGIPDAAERFIGPGDVSPRRRDPESHKGDAGTILVIGGGPYTGAPALTGLAALRAGADLSYVVCPDVVADRIAGYSPNLIVTGVDGEHITPDHVPTVLDRAEDADAIVVGPGLGDADATCEAVASFLAEWEGRCVVDADALAVVPEVDTGATLVCTPHAGEFEQMGGPALSSTGPDREVAVTEHAQELGHVLVVKGNHDVISDGDRVRLNRTGNPGMTVGGTGDVLAGVIATWLAGDETDAFAAGAVGAYITGAAGDVAADSQGNGLLATDVIEAIPAAVGGADDD